MNSVKKVELIFQKYIPITSIINIILNLILDEKKGCKYCDIIDNMNWKNTQYQTNETKNNNINNIFIFVKYTKIMINVIPHNYKKT